jgi:hypothetical protein
MSNKAKSERLGMSYSKASHQLRKKIMFSLIQKAGLNKCYRCGKVIANIDNLSIEHKTSWFTAENPLESFWDLNNIAFSHLRCNCSWRNMSSIVKSKSGYKGVYFEQRRKKWRAFFDNKTIGRFDTPVEAAEAYDEEAIKQQGERAITNKILGLL